MVSLTELKCQIRRRYIDSLHLLASCMQHATLCSLFACSTTFGGRQAVSFVPPFFLAPAGLIFFPAISFFKPLFPRGSDLASTHHSSLITHHSFFPPWPCGPCPCGCRRNSYGLNDEASIESKSSATEKYLHLLMRLVNHCRGRCIAAGWSSPASAAATPTAATGCTETETTTVDLGGC